ncbi:MAG: hypothetical protein ACQESK_09465 [Bacteroidota bacterium]
MKKINIGLLALAISFSFACNDAPKQKDEKKTDKSEKVEKKKKEISLKKLEGSPKFPEASLEMVNPENNQLEAGETEFAFKVENYNLKDQTEDAGDNGLANSHHGQHVHFILNNGPYSAHYEDAFTKDLEVGEHIVLAFLSRSYHESVKGKDASTLSKITVGEPNDDQKIDFDFDAPHLFYSRPKGEYVGRDQTKKVLLDFYLFNTELSKEGNRVEVTINGDKKFTVDDWAPYYMTGLPMGENTVKLKLVDSKGKLIEGPFNEVERTFTLKKGKDEKKKMKKKMHKSEKESK